MIRFYLIILLFLFSSLTLSAQSKIYVDGSIESIDCMDIFGTLEHPYISLQDALTAFSVGEGDTILVAQGVYYPDESECGVTDTDDRSVSFVIPNGVVMMGGYNSTFTERDFINTPSILSGDIDQNAPDVGNNSFHVVRTFNVESNTVMDGFTITGGNGNGANENSLGGGWYNAGSDFGNSSNPTVRNCRFISNFAGTGGAMFNSTMFNGESSPTLINCQFRGNESVYEGGAMYNLGAGANSSPTLINVLFAGNKAGTGGAVYNMGNSGESSTTLINCVFSGNEANVAGAMYNSGFDGECSPVIRNSIFYNNYSEEDGLVFYNNYSSPVISYSMFDTPYSELNIGEECMNCVDITEEGNKFSIDPLFVDAPQASEAPTLAGDFHLQLNSPAINMGDPSTDMNQFLQGNGMPVDLDGNPRFLNGTIDMGVYERETSTISCMDYVDGIAYVDSSATGANNGTSWQDAFTDLQDALRLHDLCPLDTILVAQGTYFPSRIGTRDTSFWIPDGVVVLGGFPAGGSAVVDRDWDAYRTILSGNGDGEDAIVGNSIHVVRTANVGLNTVLSGFTITAGYAASAIGDNYGAGMFNENSSPTISHCIFRGNQANMDGAGMYNTNSSPHLINVVFTGNTINGMLAYGGGLFNQNSSSPILINCLISDNFSIYGGAGIANLNGSSPTLVNTTIFGNTGAAISGVGMYNGDNSSPTLINSIIWGNCGLGGATISLLNENNSSPVISYSIIEDSGGSDNWDAAMGADGGFNKDVDPLFVMVSSCDLMSEFTGDAHLMPESPAIDMGVNSANLESYDLDGLLRIQNGTIDLGPFESESCSGFANDTTVMICGVIDEAVTIDLTAYEDGIYSGTTSTFTYFEDADAEMSIGDATSYSSTGGTVYVVVNTGSCTDTADLTLTILEAPIALDASLSACEILNGEAIFDLTSAGESIHSGMGITYTYFEDHTATTVIADSTAYSSSGGVVYVVINNGTCTDTAELTLTVLELPDAQDASLTACEMMNGEAVFDLTAAESMVNGGTEITFAYFSDPTAETSISDFTAYTSSGGTVYVVVDNETCTDTAELTLTVLELPDAQDASLTACETMNGEAVFDLTAAESMVNGGTEITFTYFSDPTAETSISDFTTYTSSDGTVYIVVDNGACTDTAELNLTVLEPPVAQDASLQECEAINGGTIFDLTSAEGTIHGGMGITYSYFSNQNTDIPIVDATAFMATGDTVIYVVISDGSCTDTADLTLTVLENPTALDASLNACGTTDGNAIFDLTSAESIINGGTGITFAYYEDEDALNAITDAMSYTSMGGSVFVVVNDGMCTDTSELVLNVSTALTANNAILSTCEISDGESLFDLTQANDMINGSGGLTYGYFVDVGLTNEITNPTAYESTGGIVFVLVSDGMCSGMAQIQLNVSPAPSVACQTDTTVAACLTQSEIDLAFNNWLAGFSSDCEECETSDLSGYEAPGICGEQTTVNYVITDTCGVRKDSCEATFQVLAPSPLEVFCPAKQIVGAELTDQNKQDIFQYWLTSLTYSGGCNVMVEHNGTTFNDAVGSVDGITVVQWTVTSSCGEPVICTGTFTVEAPGGEDPPNCSVFAPSLNADGEIMVTAEDFLSNPDRARFPVTVTLYNQWGGVISKLELTDFNTVIPWDACSYLGRSLNFSVHNEAGECNNGVMNLPGNPGLVMTSAWQASSGPEELPNILTRRSTPITGPHISQGKINVYCGNVPEPADHAPMVTDPCSGRSYQATVQPDWIMPFSCNVESDTAEVIFRTWEVFDKEKNLHTLTDTIVVFRLPRLTPGAFIGQAEETYYCSLEAEVESGDAVKRYASWKQPVGLHDYERPYDKLGGLTYEIPATIILAGLTNAFVQGDDVFTEYLESVILRKADGAEVTIGDLITGKYASDLIANATAEQKRYGFLQILIELNENPLTFLAGIEYEFYPYLLLEEGDWILSEGGNFEKVESDWFYTGNGVNPYWFAGGWPSIYGSGACVSFCDTGGSADFSDCISVLVPALTIENGMGGQAGCDTICLSIDNPHCGITIDRQEMEGAWTRGGAEGVCPQTRGLDTWITQTCWASSPNYCAEDAFGQGAVPCGDLSADDNPDDAVVDYSCTDKVIKIQISQWQTLVDTRGPLFDFCYPYIDRISAGEFMELLGPELSDFLDELQQSILESEVAETLENTELSEGVLIDLFIRILGGAEIIESILNSGNGGILAKYYERFNPVTYRVGSHDCSAEVFVPDVQVVDNCSGIHSVKAMVDLPGGVRSVALEQTGVEYKIMSNGDTCYVYTYSHLSNPIKLPFNGCDGDLTEVRYEATDNCWNQSEWFKYITVEDDVPPTVVANRDVNVTLDSKTEWVEASRWLSGFDEGSWDNCAIELQLARRTDWLDGIDVCGSVGPNAGEGGVYHDWVDVLDDLGIDRAHARAAANGSVPGAAAVNDKISIHDLSVFLNEGEVEEYFFHQIVWMWEDGQNCGPQVVHAWIFSLAKAIAEHCAAADEHGVGLDLRELETIFDHLFGEGGYGNEVALMGGGWAQAVPFNCEDACQEVSVELLVMDYCCNWGIGWSDAHVEDKSNPRLVKRLPDLAISCEAYNIFYKDIVEAAAAFGETGSSADTTGVFADLDAALGGYIKAWVDPDNYQGRPTGSGFHRSNGLSLADSLLNFDYNNVSCVEMSETRKDSVIHHDGTIGWEPVVTKTTYLDTATLSTAHGIIGVNCAATYTQDIWIDLDDCGQGTITRRFFISSGCGEGISSWEVDQVITIGSACGMRESMFDLPANVGTQGEPVCLDQPISDQNIFNSIGSMSLKPHLSGQLCNSFAIGSEVKELDVMGGSGNMKSYEITWRAIDWCADATSTTREISYTQEVFAVIDPGCEVRTDVIGGGVNSSQVATGERVSQDGFVLHQNRPNPFEGYTVIGFDLPEATEGRLIIYDVTGKVLQEIRGEYGKGYNEVMVSRKDLPAIGVMYYQLETEAYVATKRMIVR